MRENIPLSWRLSGLLSVEATLFDTGRTTRARRRYRARSRLWTVLWAAPVNSVCEFRWAKRVKSVLERHLIWTVGEFQRTRARLASPVALIHRPLSSSTRVHSVSLEEEKPTQRLC